MPFIRPTLAQIVDRIQTDIEARFPGADARTRRSVFDVLARVQSAGEHGLHGYLSWIARQVLPDLAEAEMLERHGGIWGVRRNSASYATGSVVFSGINGVTIEPGSTLRRGDGREYIVTSSASVAGGTATCQVSSVLPGLGANTAAGTSIALISPIAGVNSAAVVAGAGLAGGADRETDDSYRGRILDRIREPPHGGNIADYERWAKETTGVTRVWVTPEESGPGSVSVRFMMDDVYANGIPLAADVANVAAHIEPLRPVTANVLVGSPIPVPLNFTLSYLLPNTQAIRDAILAELADLILREGAPGGTIYISRIREAISAATGEFDHVLSFPVENIVYGIGQIPIMGTITWP